jgi:hypothetical protein
MQAAARHGQVNRGRYFVSFQQTSFHLPVPFLLFDEDTNQHARARAEIKSRQGSRAAQYVPSGEGPNRVGCNRLCCGA